MEILGCPVCALAGSGGAVVAGFLAGRCSARRRGRRAADRRSRGRTMRSWPGGGAHRGDHPRGRPLADPDDGTAGPGGGAEP
jgi:hypothetical protein